MFGEKRDGLEGPAKLVGLASALIAGLLAGACAQSIGPATSSIAENGNFAARPQAPMLLQAEASSRDVAFWAERYSKQPRDLAVSLSYARSLKAAGQRENALSVLQDASTHFEWDRELASEYGRLALDLGHLKLAEKLLEKADDPNRPDWRIISATGTLLAKQGQYGRAIPYYERALELAPGQSSVASNLGLALVAHGQLEKGEAYLRRATEARGSDPRTRQNLVLALELRGKQDEAKRIAALDLPADNASVNVDYAPRVAVQNDGAAGGRTRAPAVLGWSATTSKTLQP